MQTSDHHLFHMLRQWNIWQGPDLPWPPDWSDSSLGPSWDSTVKNKSGLTPPTHLYTPPSFTKRVISTLMVVMVYLFLDQQSNNSSLVALSSLQALNTTTNDNLVRHNHQSLGNHVLVDNSNHSKSGILHGISWSTRMWKTRPFRVWPTLHSTGDYDCSTFGAQSPTIAYGPCILCSCFDCSHSLESQIQ